MKITFFSLRDDFARLRLSTIMASIFLIIFGIQGLFNLFNKNIMQIEHIELYSISFIGIGLILLIISCLKRKNDEIEYYSLYTNSN